VCGPASCAVLSQASPQTADGCCFAAAGSYILAFFSWYRLASLAILMCAPDKGSQASPSWGRLAALVLRQPMLPSARSWPAAQGRLTRQTMHAAQAGCRGPVRRSCHVRVPVTCGTGRCHVRVPDSYGVSRVPDSGPMACHVFRTAGRHGVSEAMDASCAVRCALEGAVLLTAARHPPHSSTSSQPCAACSMRTEPARAGSCVHAPRLPCDHDHSACRATRAARLLQPGIRPSLRVSPLRPSESPSLRAATQSRMHVACGRDTAAAQPPA
jgi:hypothetical protein